MTDRPPFEIVRPPLPRRSCRAAVFDFDGTLSLLREGWPAIMVEVIVEILRAAPNAESVEELAALAEEIAVTMNGQPTLEQMVRVAYEFRRRGGTPDDPHAYKAEYLRRLLAVVDGRIAEIESGRVPPDRWAVPGGRALLDALAKRGVVVALASGTDRPNVVRECTLLGLAPYFGERIHAPDDVHPFSKGDVIDRLLIETGLPGVALVGFGDGVVETREVKRVGGFAAAVASDVDHPGCVNEWKRSQLLPAGAGVVIADFTNLDRLLEWFV